MSQSGSSDGAAPAAVPPAQSGGGAQPGPPHNGVLRVVLADDEELGRAHLNAYINAINRDSGGPDAVIKVVGLCADGRAAVDAVIAQRPDVLFLDVSMPDLDGFGVVAELAAKVPHHLPQIVFVTAHDAHAVRAFDMNALDFIRKPLSRERFVQAIARARGAIAQRRQGEQHEQLVAWIAANKVPRAMDAVPGAGHAPPQTAQRMRDDVEARSTRLSSKLASPGALAGDTAYAELTRRARLSGSHENAMPPGHMLHEYRIERVLGAGGFGMTYLAYDTNLNAQVAIKEYLPRDLSVRTLVAPDVRPRDTGSIERYQRGLERFLLESRTLAAFRHPHIVRVNRFFEAHGTACMVMDYELGEGLHTWVKKRIARGESAPDEKALVRMFVPLLQGLEQVHKAGFLHRDIKPANIYIRDRDGSLVLLDFGAARQTSAMAEGGMTSIFSPGYSPFEQYHRFGPQGPWSDLYAMGSVLYWFVTGQRPVDAAARMQDDPQKPAAQLAKGKYSAAFLQAIDWALTLDEKSRPQTVDEFLPVIAGEAGAMGWLKKKLGRSALGTRNGDAG